MKTSRYFGPVAAAVSIVGILAIASRGESDAAAQPPAPACCEDCPAAAERLTALERRVTDLERQVRALSLRPGLIMPRPRDPRLWGPHDFYIQPVEPLPQRLDRRRIHSPEQP